MPRYIIDTEKQDINGRENWHTTVSYSNGHELTDRDGDTESESITIAMVELLGNLPADFPRTLIAGLSDNNDD